MQFLSWTFLKNRIVAIKSMMKDPTVKKSKKILVIFGIIYLFLPVDIIPPVLFPFGFLDDLILWIWIIWHLKDTLDTYWVGEKTVDYSNSFKNNEIIENVDYTVSDEDENSQNAKSEEDISYEEKSDNTSYDTNSDSDNEEK